MSVYYQKVMKYDSDQARWREYNKVEKYVDLTKVPFYVEDVSGSDSVLSIVKYSVSSPTLTIKYSYDNEVWNTLGDTSTSVLYCNIPANSRVYLKCQCLCWSSNGLYNHISCNRSYNVGGNIMSLLYGDSDFSNQKTLSFSYSFNAIFYGDTNLVNASNLILPATTLSESCYQSMFYGCTSLINAPELTATTLAESCYQGMFFGCSSLTTAPSLPAITLTTNCYDQMFFNCISLTNAPSLHASTLATNCYRNMFNGCTSLTTAPALPATTLAQFCYQYMFSGCTSLATAPSLPAIILADSCYDSMFYGCTSLTTAPSLPATTLVSSCYKSMFRNCTILNDVTIYADDISANQCLYYWLNSVSSTGVFHKYGTATYPTNSPSGIPINWIVDDVMKIPFNIKNTSNDVNKLSITKSNENAPSITVEYSTDNNVWTTLGVTSTTPLEYNIPVNGKIYLRATTQRWCAYQSENANIISCDKSHLVSGNIMSLLYGSNFDGTETSLTGGYEFKMLFKDNTHLDTDGLQLPATNLYRQTYHTMFYGCTSLTTPPSILPATTATQACYYSMFYGCVSLTKAPKILATSLGESSCMYMFYDCSSLVDVFDFVTTQVELQSCCNMFQNCTSLIKAPELPATTLFTSYSAGSCYLEMFRNCTSLQYAPSTLPATTGTANCYYYMFWGCSSLITTPEIFLDNIIGCRGMFYGCRQVKEIIVHANSITSGETTSWLTNVAPSGTFHNLGSATYPSGASGIPSGWTEVHQ